MCGIVGAASFLQGGLYNPEIDAFKQLLVVDSVRGSDGTGVFCVKKDGKSSIAKIVGSPFNFLKNDASNQFFIKAFQDGKALIGHNRLATKGGVSSETAHPFRHKDISLVHNGTLLNHHSFPEFSKNELQVDSNLLPVLLYEKTYEETFEQIEGAFAVVFHDARSNTLNLIRNKERPLFFGLNAKDNKLYISSEKGALDWILDRNNLEGGTIIYETTPGRMYKFAMDGHEADYTTQDYKLYSRVYMPPVVTPAPIYRAPQRGGEVVPFNNKRRSGPHSHLKIGAFVHFDLIDTDSLGKDRVLVRGVLPWSNDYQITAVVAKSMEDNIISSTGLRGRIEKIREIKRGKVGTYEYNITVTDLVTITPILSKNGRYLFKDDLDKIEKDGCIACKAPVPEKELSKSIWNSGAKALFCPQCSIANQMDIQHNLFPVIDATHNSHTTH